MAKTTEKGNVTTLSGAKEARTLAFNKEHYGEVIRNYRMKAGLSQPQLAALLGVQKNYITHWEAGRARPDLNIIPALCEALHLSIPAFFGAPGSQEDLSLDESHLVKGYRKINARDRLLISNTLDKMIELSEAELWERCRISFIPIMHNYQQAAAGSGVMLDEATEQYQTFIKRSALAERADEIVTVNGSSMEPMFYHEQDVFVEHTNELAVGNPDSRALIMTHDLFTAVDIGKMCTELMDDCNRKYNGQGDFLYSPKELRDNHVIRFINKRNEYTTLLELVYDYANGGAANQEPYIGNIIRQVLEAFSTFEFKKKIEEVSVDDEILALMENEEHRLYFKNLMYRLVLNEGSHRYDQTRNMQIDFFSFISEPDKRRTAKDVLCFMELLNTPHVKAHIGADCARVIDGWCEDILSTEEA